MRLLQKVEERAPFAALIAFGIAAGSSPLFPFAKAILLAIEQPSDVNVNEIIVRPTASLA
ncbi:hypothetical protein ASF12_28180 [Paenibacillus sp. Leaf72]|nr:hypothetical protein ASF12_28180 [Paenibacillus sp. Leaf72]